MEGLLAVLIYGICLAMLGVASAPLIERALRARNLLDIALVGYSAFLFVPVGTNLLLAMLELPPLPDRMYDVVWITLASYQLFFALAARGWRRFYTFPVVSFLMVLNTVYDTEATLVYQGYSLLGSALAAGALVVIGWRNREGTVLGAGIWLSTFALAFLVGGYVGGGAFNTAPEILILAAGSSVFALGTWGFLDDRVLLTAKERDREERAAAAWISKRMRSEEA